LHGVCVCVCVSVCVWMRFGDRVSMNHTYPCACAVSQCMRMCVHVCFGDEVSMRHATPTIHMHVHKTTRTSIRYMHYPGQASATQHINSLEPGMREMLGSTGAAGGRPPRPTVLQTSSPAASDIAIVVEGISWNTFFTYVQWHTKDVRLTQVMLEPPARVTAARNTNNESDYARLWARYT
jgi:hypothetical protein